jgi:uncharacterized DUF497 family protein
MCICLTVDFEWDPRKATANLKKHGVEFADAALVLYDDFALTTPTPVTPRSSAFPPSVSTLWAGP